MSATHRHLLKMANDIAANTRSGKSEEEAAEAIASHMRRFWTPQMREQFRSLCAERHVDLANDVLQAADRL